MVFTRSSRKYYVVCSRKSWRCTVMLINVWRAAEAKHWLFSKQWSSRGEYHQKVTWWTDLTPNSLSSRTIANTKYQLIKPIFLILPINGLRLCWAASPLPHKMGDLEGLVNCITCSSGMKSARNAIIHLWKPAVKCTHSLRSKEDQQSLRTSCTSRKQMSTLLVAAAISWATH